MISSYITSIFHYDKRGIQNLSQENASSILEGTTFRRLVRRSGFAAAEVNPLSSRARSHWGSLAADH